jgi:hypothetical protein
MNGRRDWSKVEDWDVGLKFLLAAVAHKADGQLLGGDLPPSDVLPDVVKVDRRRNDLDRLNLEAKIIC